MVRLVFALLAGIVFGLGLAVSQMVNPAKVLAFLDIAGRWDPSLAFVMGGALAVSALGFRLAARRPAPFLAREFRLPRTRPIDGELLLGAAVFGVGWGLVGYCPGPAFAAVGLVGAEPLVFIAAMIAGAWIHQRVGRAPIASPRLGHAADRERG